jgi:Holliday junction resolvasome RuvABC endonuclease subunit
MAERLLALDVGAVCGWAAGDVGDPYPERLGSRRLPGSSVRDLLGARLDVFENWLGGLLYASDITLLAMAERFRTRNTGEAAMAWGLDGVTHMVCYRLQIPVLVQPEGTVRKELLGRGSGKSEQMKALAMTWCAQHHLTVATHHEADAAVLWTWASRELIKNVAPTESKPQPVARQKRNHRKI